MDPNFINIDVYPYPNVHFVRDVTSPRLWKEEGADVIYASHVLEHVERSRVQSTLDSWHRILRVGGLLRLSVPDFDAIVEIYTKRGNDIETIALPLMGGQLNQADFHYAIFNRASLADALHKSGFAVVRAWDPKNCNDHIFDDYSILEFDAGEKKIPISLNLEAIKS